MPMNGKKGIEYMDSFDIETRRKKVFEMREKGMKMKDIAAELGVSKQRASQIYNRQLSISLGVHHLTAKNIEIINRIVFPTIQKMLLESNTSLSDYVHEHRFNNEEKMKRILVGEAKNFDIASVRELMESTGMTFEELFEGVCEE